MCQNFFVCKHSLTHMICNKKIHKPKRKNYRLLGFIFKKCKFELTCKISRLNFCRNFIFYLEHAINHEFSTFFVEKIYLLLGYILECAQISAKVSTEQIGFSVNYFFANLISSLKYEFFEAT